MITEVEAPPSIVVREVATSDPAMSGTATTATEVDFDRILSGDEAYIAETNQKLAEDVPADVAHEEADQKTKDESKAAPPAPDPEEEDDMLMFRGKERPIPPTKKEQKALMQKGLALDARTAELSHLIALEREAPDVYNLARTPEGRKQIVERIRQKEQAQAEDDTPEVEGYDKSDVKAVDQILKARMKALGIMPAEQAGKPTPAQQEAFQRDQEDLSAKTRITLESLRAIDPNYERNMELLKEVVAEVERTTDPQKFREFYDVVNDPRKIDPATGKPAFLHFYADVNKERERREALEAKPAVPAIPAISRKAPSVSGGRLAPGSAISPAVNVSAGVLKFGSQDDFNRAFDEALSRG